MRQQQQQQQRLLKRPASAPLRKSLAPGTFTFRPIPPSSVRATAVRSGSAAQLSHRRRRFSTWADVKVGSAGQNGKRGKARPVVRSEMSKGSNAGSLHADQRGSIPRQPAIGASKRTKRRKSKVRRARYRTRAGGAVISEAAHRESSHPGVHSRLPIFEEDLEVRPVHNRLPNGSRTAMWYFLSGYEMRTRGRFESAIREYSRAHALDPDDCRPLNNRAHAHLRLGHLDEAIDDYKSAILLEPLCPELWFNLGLALQRGEDFTGSTTCFTETLECIGKQDLPNETLRCAALKCRALSRRKTNDFEGAVADLGRIGRPCYNVLTEGLISAREEALREGHATYFGVGNIFEVVKDEQHTDDLVINNMETAERLASCPVDQRSEQDVEMLSSSIQHIAILHHLQAEPRRELMHHAGISAFAEGEVVFLQGEVGNLLYVVLAGAVSVHICKASRDTRQTPAGSNPFSWEARRLKATDGFFNESEASQILATSDYVATIHAGFSFGDQALMRKESTRNASIMAAEKTVLMTIPKIDFDRIIREHHEQNIDSLFHFLRRLDVFTGLRDEALRFLAGLTKCRHYHCDDIVAAEGAMDRAGIFTIVRTGKLRIVKGLQIIDHDEQHRAQLERLQEQIDMEEDAARKQQMKRQMAQQRAMSTVSSRGGDAARFSVEAHPAENWEYRRESALRVHAALAHRRRGFGSNDSGRHDDLRRHHKLLAEHYHSSQGKIPTEISLLLPRDFYGEEVLLGSISTQAKPNRASIVAVTTSEVLEMKKHDIFLATNFKERQQIREAIVAHRGKGMTHSDHMGSPQIRMLESELWRSYKRSVTQDIVNKHLSMPFH